jgi:hypothetical protein
MKGGARMKNKRLRLVSVVLFSLLIGSISAVAFAQLSIEGDWLFDLSGSEKGGAVLTITGNTFTGYAFVANKGYIYPMAGDYTLDAKGKITGHFSSPESQSMTGKMGKNGISLSLTVTGGPKMKGVRLPGDPAIPKYWSVKVSKATGAFQPFTIEPQGNPRIFNYSGSGVFEDMGTINVTGSFFVTSKNAVYGTYTASGGVSQIGFLSGKIDPSAGTFKWKLVSIQDEKSTLSGEAD